MKENKMRPIDADTLWKVFENSGWWDNADRDIAEDLLDKAPTVDVESVRHGRWEYDPNGMDFNLGAWVCSKCKRINYNLGGKRRINPYQFVGSRFCPNCGAKMGLEEEDK
ncbi:MAG: hypothetical protein ACOCPA_10610 [Segatella copri]